MKTLYQLLTEDEVIRVKKETQVRNVYFNDLTVEELKELAPIVTLPPECKRIPDFAFVTCLKVLNVRNYHDL